MADLFEPVSKDSAHYGTSEREHGVMGPGQSNDGEP